MFHHQLKHREESRKYDAQRSIFDDWNFDVFHLVMKQICLIFLLKQNGLAEEIKDAKMSGFLSDFQTLIFKHFKFPLYFLSELLISLRSILFLCEKPTVTFLL